MDENELIEQTDPSLRPLKNLSTALRDAISPLGGAIERATHLEFACWMTLATLAEASPATQRTGETCFSSPSEAAAHFRQTYAETLLRDRPPFDHADFRARMDRLKAQTEKLKNKGEERPKCWFARIFGW